MVEQLSVFIENEPGRLAQMCRVLGDAGFNMHALVVADTSEFGVARVLCDRPHAARHVLEGAGFACSVTRVIAVAVPDRAGGLADVLERLEAASVNLEYLYCYVRPGGGVAVDILRVEDPDAATDALQQGGFELVRAVEIYEPDAG